MESRMIAGEKLLFFSFPVRPVELSLRFKYDTKLSCLREGFFRNPLNCSRFYRCVDFDGYGKRFTLFNFDCPKGLVFDEQENLCNWPSVAPPCDNVGIWDPNSTTEKPSEDQETTQKPITATDDNEASVRTGDTTEEGASSPSDSGSTEESVSTPSGSNSTEEEGTSSPSDSGSAEDSDSSAESDEITQDETSSSSDNSDTPQDSVKDVESIFCYEPGFFRHPSNCSKFYRCVNTSLEGPPYYIYFYECPKGLWFDESYYSCNWPYMVPSCNTDDSSVIQKGKDSDLRSKVPGKSETHVAFYSHPSRNAIQNDNHRGGFLTAINPDVSRLVCLREGFFRHPNNCKKFYGCSDLTGTAMTFNVLQYDCPDELVFDEATCSCRLPQFAPPCENSASDNPQTGEMVGVSEPSSPAEQDSPSDSKEGGDNQYPDSPVGSDIPPGSEISGPDDSLSSSLQETGDGQTSKQISCSKAGFFRHPENCHKFYRCVNLTETGEPFAIYMFDCPGGLVFDETIESCNWPNKAPLCDSQQTSIGSDEIPLSPGQERIQDDTKAKDQNSKSGPDQPDSSKSETGSSPEADNEIGQPPPEGEETEPIQGESNPQVDDVPEGGPRTQPVSEEPPQGETVLIGNENDENLARESSGSDQTSASESSQKPTGASECTKAGFFRDPNDCTRFYRCVEQGQIFIKYKFNCPDDLVFDERHGVCNWASKAPLCETKGSQARNSTPESELQSENSTSESGPSSGDVLPEIESTSEISTTVSGPPSGAPSDSSKESSKSSHESSSLCLEVGFFRNPRDCHKFYRCVDFGGNDGHFSIFEFDCPDGLVFDERESICNWPDQSPPCNENTACPPTDSSENSTDDGETEGTTIPTDITTESTETTTQGNVIVDVGSLYDCQVSGNFPFESDCVRFYRCEERASGLIGLLYRCPDGYIFDEKIALCRKKPNDFVCTKSPPNLLIYRADSFILDHAILASSNFLFD
ncbi:dentin sialophosphoprotein-like [Limulus polyphemus]|uniref:Dentin sialophosphoprotein-like n=1 Tax=Limulus polyphemus TaxID=6850 RepID=A0ABM1C608_LIMPO|nr:dentin sialophosphoprotein-like [Limulus polyphemus]